jgi:phenylpropionate dioxygenase-like ring-hydroxylating dioxygenase large terminal subunit
VENPAFKPGPYSREREYNVIAFDAWYLERMSSTGLGAWGSR